LQHIPFARERCTLPRFSIIPIQPKFFDYFEDSVANLAKAAKEFADLMENFENASIKVARITELEHEGDSITHQVMKQLHRSFLTPIDREDIALLSERLDSVLDFIEDAANSMVIYHIDKPTKRARELSAILLAITKELSVAVPYLRKQSKMRQILDHCVEINRLENEADAVLRLALAELFESASLAEVIKWREIYEHLENAADRGEDVANVLEGVVLKHG
jgi:predicted phosphate transport protein (TIGR00153 family)